MTDLTQDGATIVVVAMATQALKPLLPKKVIPLITWLIGGIIGGAMSAITHNPVAPGVIRGLIAGAANNGVYSQVKRMKKAPPA